VLRVCVCPFCTRVQIIIPSAHFWREESAVVVARCHMTRSHAQHNQCHPERGNVIGEADHIAESKESLLPRQPPEAPYPKSAPRFWMLTWVVKG